MITVNTILKSTMRKWCCMTNLRVGSKNNMTGASSETGTFSSLSKCTLLFRVNTIFGYSFHSICLDFFLFCGSLYIFFNVICIYQCPTLFRYQMTYHYWTVTANPSRVIPGFCEEFELIYLYMCMIVCLVFFKSLFVLLSFFFCQLYWMSVFDILLLITPFDIFKTFLNYK